MIYEDLFGCVFAYPIQVFTSLDNILQMEQEQLFQAQFSISSKKIQGATHWGQQYNL